MSFKEIMGHRKTIQMLQRAMINDRVLHSYLFLGNEGIGKKEVALQFAKALNCLQRGPTEGDACDQCLSCKKIDNRLHPDVLLLEPEGPSQMIKVDRVRQMQKDLAYQPYEGKRRVCILTAADRMAPEIPNTLLKTLEEPPLHTTIILLANNSRQILPTILSRCQQIHFSPIPSADFMHWLTAKKGMNDEEAHLLSSFSEGSPGKALQLRDRIHQVKREGLLQGWLSMKTFSFGQMEAWIESLPSEDLEALFLMLEVAKTLLRDLAVMKVLGDSTKLIHSDLSREVEALASEHSLSFFLSRLESIHQTMVSLIPDPRKPNTKLALEAMMLSWAEG